MEQTVKLDEGLERRHVLALERTEELLKSIIIPPRPAILLSVLNEQAKPDVSTRDIAHIIGQDVAIAAGTLKVVNSPFFGLKRKCTAIEHAVNLLGVDNVVRIVTGLMLNSAFSDSNNLFMEQFWADSNNLALIAMLTARELGIVSPEESYVLGLFSNCGVPVLMRRFKEYTSLYKQTLGIEDKPQVALENQRIGTDHAVVGYMVGKTWQLPLPFCECILRHHDTYDYFSQAYPPLEDTTPLLATLKVAQHINRTISKLPPSYEWGQLNESISALLSLDAELLDRLTREAEAFLQEN